MITNQMLKHLAITPNFSEAERFVCKELQVAPLEAVITNLQHKHGTTVEDAFKIIKKLIDIAEQKLFNKR